MGINEDRKKRASEFISVRQVIKAISESEGLPVGDIAGELIHYLEMPGGFPMFYSQNPATLVMRESDFAFMRSILNSIVKWGKLEWPDRNLLSPSDLDEFGWNRHDIGEFLLVFMGIFPDCCDPDWEAAAELTPVPSASEGSVENQPIEYQQIQCIESETLGRLMQAIEAFPVKYPDYKSKPPKLNDDVRVWLNTTGKVKDGQKGREAHVFGKIIAEHFKL